MKVLLQIALVIIGLLLAYMLLATALGMLFWVALAGIVACVVFALGRAWWQARQNKRPPDAQVYKKAEKQAEAALKDLERKVN